MPIENLRHTVFDNHVRKVLSAIGKAVDVISIELQCVSIPNEYLNKIVLPSNL